MRHLVLLVLAVSLAVPGVTEAQIYVKRDERGVLVLSDKPLGDGAVTFEVPTSQAVRVTRAANPATAARYSDVIERQASRHRVRPELVRAVIQVESGFDPLARSPKGAMGLMQLMPQTALDMNVKNTFSPHENIEGGVRYLRTLLDRYEGNLSLALAAYNSGETAVKRWGTIPPFKETKEYVSKVLALYQGTGHTPAVRYTIYIGHATDGTLVLTDNPSNHPGKTLHRKWERDL